VCILKVNTIVLPPRVQLPFVFIFGDFRTDFDDVSYLRHKIPCI